MVIAFSRRSPNSPEEQERFLADCIREGMDDRAGIDLSAIFVRLHLNPPSSVTTRRARSSEAALQGELDLETETVG
jgi:hypothetical protein